MIFANDSTTGSLHYSTRWYGLQIHSHKSFINVSAANGTTISLDALPVIEFALPFRATYNDSNNIGFRIESAKPTMTWKSPEYSGMFLWPALYSSATTSYTYKSGKYNPRYTQRYSSAPARKKSRISFRIS